MSMKKSGVRRLAGTAEASSTVSGALVDETTTSTWPSAERELVETERPAADSLRELAGRRRRAVRDEGDLGAARSEVRRGELADPAGTDQQHAPAGEVAEHLPGERRCRRGDGGRALADRRLAAHPLADRERLAEHVIEQRARVDGLVRRAHLAEDLALARHERVESGSNPEEVQRRGVLVQAVDDAFERLARNLLERDQHVSLVDPVDVELGAVAGGEADGVSERAGKRSGRVEVDADAFAELDGCDVMRQADQRERHSKWLPASASRAKITSTKPPSARNAARRPVGRAIRNPP